MSDIKSRWRSSAGIVQARKLVSQTQLTPALVFLFALVFLLALPSWRSSQQPSYAERISPASANVAAQEQQHSDVGRGSARASPCPALPAMISRSTDADLAMGTDPKLPAAFFLPRTYAQRYNNSYDPEPASAERITSWQYQVYESARALAVQLKPPAIIDVGCGSGVKLAKLRDVAESLYCLDFGDNLANVAKDFPFIKPIEIDLNKDIRTLIPRSTLRDAIVINADNIEHVGSAIDLIGAFGVWMQDAAVLLLSTPDRVRHGFSPAGPPPNKAHVRDLTLCEMVTLISKHGPRIAAAGWTENHTKSRLPITLFIVVLRDDLSHPVIPPRVAPINSTEDAAIRASLAGPNGYGIGRGIELPTTLYRPWRMDEALACISEMQRPSVRSTMATKF